MGSLRYAVAAVMVTLAASAPAAGAATRYAAPDGSGPEPCAEAAPCALEPAIEGAVNDDEVIVKSGTYGSVAAPLTNQILTSARVDLHGEDGKPRPVIHMDVLNALAVDNTQAKTRRLHIANQAINGLWAKGTVDQMYVETDSTSGDACAVVGGLWRNTVCRSTAANAAAASLSSSGNATVTLRNVTAWATGANSVGVRCAAVLGADVTVNVTNSILQGSFSDLRAQTDGSASTTCGIVVGYSNYNTATSTVGGSVTPSAGNQGAAPLLANAAGGDFHQVTGSPTIDMGQMAPENGTADMDGDQRQVNLPDIGADEVTPAPVATTGDPSAVTTSGATVSGSVDANAGATTYRFEYGTTDTYGTATPLQAAGNSADPVNVSANLSGLAPNTTYHYRVVASSEAGATKGADRTFTTATPPPEVTTGAASSVTRTTATVAGAVNGKTAPETLYYFEFGPTTSYGQTTAVQVTPYSESGTAPVSANLSGLTPGTTYHYRLVASSTAGTTQGADQTFTTEAIPPPTLGSVKLERRVFAIGSKLPALLPAQAKTPIGTTIRFSLNEAATVKLSFRKLVGGRRVGSKCRAPSRANVGRPRCTRKVKVKPSIALLGRAGVNRVRFHGRLDAKRRLGLGRHELAIVATDFLGRTSPATRASFRIAPR